jgi:uncharacterized protein with FMN-binding domain
VNGAAVDVGYGTVQVQVRIYNGHLASVVALQAPSDGHSSDITAYAVPTLQSEAISAQSANIQAVSGATYTSQGFQTSLQSALDAAHFG